jgi:hypothetical protein
MIGRVIKIAAVAGVIGAGYLAFQPQADRALQALRDRWDLLRKDTAVVQAPTTAVSETVAEEAQRKLARLVDGSRRETFTTHELQSLLQYRYETNLPEFVTSPRIAVERDQLAISVRLPTARVPGAGELGQILELLPDTTDLELRGVLLPADDGFVDFTIDAISAQRIPLPARIVPAALDMFGREDAPGLPDDAVRIPLPDGARTAYVRSDSLVVLSSHPR